MDEHWHHATPDEVIVRLSSSADGLTHDEAAARLEVHGPNRLPEPRKRGALIRFVLQFHNILIYVLLGSAAITASLGHLTDTLVILAVVIANAAIGFLQEGKAERAMDAIRRMLALKASVPREGTRRTVEGESLVPGDIVLLEAGDKIPADLRLIRAHGLQVQEAILTGESMAVDKQTQAVAAHAALGDRTCMAFSGTLVTSGVGRGVVVDTGASTEIGRISGMLSEVEVLTTPLVRQMDVFAKWLTILILLIAAVMLVFGYFVEHYEFSEMFIAVVGLSVAAIPEGLPAVLTITLAVGVQAMARRHAIVHGTSLTWKLVRGTKVVWATVATVTIAQFAITYLPPLQPIFATAPVPFFEGVLIVGVGVVLLLIIETEKQIRLRLRNLENGVGPTSLRD